MKFDTATLTNVIEKCFDYALDDRVPQAQQKKFLTLGKRLRGSLVNLISAQFDEGTTAVKEANDELKKINTRLKDEAETLNKIADTVKQIGSLVASLDKLLGIAVGFL